MQNRSVISMVFQQNQDSGTKPFGHVIFRGSPLKIESRRHEKIGHFGVGLVSSIYSRKKSIWW